MSQRHPTRLGRVVRCTPIPELQAFLGEEPQTVIRRWRVVVRWLGGGFYRFTSQTPLRPGDPFRLPA